MITILFLTIIVVILAYISRSKKYRFLLKVCFAIITIVLGIRYNFGNDYFSYYELFTDAQKLPFADYDKEIGWYLLCRFCNPIGFMGFVFVITFISQWLVYRFIVKNVSPQYYWFAILIYMLQPNFMVLGCSMMRQFLVMAIFLNCLEFIRQKRIIISLLIILLASTIHNISLIFIPFVFLENIKVVFSKKWFYIILILLFFIIIRFSETIAIYVAGFMIDSEADFSNYIYSAQEGKMGIRELVISIFFVFLMIRNYKKMDNHNKLACILTLVNVFLLPFTVILVMLRRLMLIFKIFEIGSYPSVIEKDNNVIYRIMFICICLCSTFIDYISFFNSETYTEAFMIYSTIFSADKFI